MRKLIPIITLTFLLYLAVTFISSSTPNFDVKSYSIIGALTLNGRSIYPDPAISRHPYLPLFLYFEAATQAISLMLKIPQIFLIKIILSIFHLYSIYAVYILAKKNIKSTLLYALNPLSLFVIAFHGQFDIIPITFILFSIFTLQKKQFTKTVLLLGAAVTIKTWPILFLIPFFKRIPKKYWLILPILPSFSLLLYSFFFHTSLFSMLRVLFVYQGVGGIWGFGRLLTSISTDKLFLISYKVLFVLGILIYSYIQKKQSIIQEIIEVLFIFFIFTPGFGIQWLLWFVPFLILSVNPLARLILIPLSMSAGIAYLSWTSLFPVSDKAISLIFFMTWIMFIGYTIVWSYRQEYK